MIKITKYPTSVTLAENIRYFAVRTDVRILSALVYSYTAPIGCVEFYDYLSGKAENDPN